MPGRVARLASGEGPEERRRQQHHERLIADHHAGGLLVRELLIEGEAERREEIHRFFEIGDLDVDEDLARLCRSHGFSCRYRGSSSRTGRTSMLPSRAGGILAATWIASFRSRASIR